MKRLLLTLGVAATAASALAGSALAQSGQSLQAQLSPLNGSGASGTANIERNGTRISVTIRSRGLTAGAPHAQHIHGRAQAISECPTLALDKDGDGLLTTVEGQPAYKPVIVSLTTSGDTSVKSALAVKRFPVAGANGAQTYSRTFTVPQAVAANLGDFAIVQHGVDLNRNGKYDGEKKSSLDPSLPLEATIPANCGVLAAMPGGAVAAGGGGTATSADNGFGLGLAGLAGALALAGAAVFVLRRRDSSASA